MHKFKNIEIVLHYLGTVPEQKVVISNFLKLEVYGNCDACMYHVNTICSNLHA